MAHNKALHKSTLLCFTYYDVVFGLFFDSQVDNKLLRLGTNRTEEIRQDLISASQMLVQLLVSACSVIFTRATLASADISCRLVFVCLSVCPSVLSRCSTQTANHANNATRYPGTLVFCCRKFRQNSNRVTPNVGAKCRWGRLNTGVVAENWRLSSFDGKRCQLSSVASLSRSP